MLLRSSFILLKLAFRVHQDGSGEIISLVLTFFFKLYSMPRSYKASPVWLIGIWTISSLVWILENVWSVAAGGSLSDCRKFLVTHVQIKTEPKTRKDRSACLKHSPWSSLLWYSAPKILGTCSSRILISISSSQPDPWALQPGNCLWAVSWVNCRAHLIIGLSFSQGWQSCAMS